AAVPVAPRRHVAGARARVGIDRERVARLPGVLPPRPQHLARGEPRAVRPPPRARARRRCRARRAAAGRRPDAARPRRPGDLGSHAGGRDLGRREPRPRGAGGEGRRRRARVRGRADRRGSDLMADATFSSWTRRGGKAIGADPVGGRPHGTLKLTATDSAGGEATPDADPSFLLYGPGDVTGLHAGTVSARYPRPGQTHADAPYHPYAELADPHPPS